jgi:hypothetical protein
MVKSVEKFHGVYRAKCADEGIIPLYLRPDELLLLTPEGLTHTEGMRLIHRI